jgi:hypothetical protein
MVIVRRNILLKMLWHQCVIGTPLSAKIWVPAGKMPAGIGNILNESIIGRRSAVRNP